MDINKEREAFEQALVNQKNVSINNLHVCTIFDAEKNKYSPSDVCDPKEDFIVDWINSSWSIWQAAKAQAVPKGFVLIKASDRDQEMLELIDQRDYMESQAEELKDKLQTLYGANFGEHSSCNFPFQNAIDYDDSDLVLVPREPNEKMIMNGLLVISTEIGKYDIQQEVRMIWEKMIEAQEPAND